MKKISLILIAVLSIAIISCKKKKTETTEVTISGKITNMKGDIFLIQPSDRPYNDWDTTYIDHEGNFVVKLEVDSPQYFQIWHGEETATIFLDGGYDLNLSLNTNEFDESLKFEGKGSEANNYLMEKFLLREQKLNYDQLVEMDPSKFFQYIQKSENELNELLSTEVKKLDYLPEAFMMHEHESITNDIIMYKIMYLSERGKVIGEVVKTSDENLKFLTEYELSDSNFMQSPIYYSYRYYYIDYLSQLEQDKDSTLSDNQIGRLTALKRVYEKVFETTEEVEKKLVNDIEDVLEDFITNPEKNSEKELLMFVMKFENQDYINKIEESLITLKNIAPGKTAPDFTYPDVEGNMVSLSDFLGKYVYIDVWATWCGPCKHEIPFLKELDEKYKDRNIVFMSVSIDRAEDKQDWIDMIIEKEMKGIQLFAGSGAPISDDYMIKYIPRFILVGPDGKIISNDASRPSDEATKELFESFSDL
jgi:thiol-disulfide isomerase/thioredoxin